MWRLLLGLLLTGLLYALWGAGSAAAPAQAGVSDQAQQGAAIFAQHCEVCHGDAGQGLDKWRLTWDEQHQNCSNYKCHGRDFPPGGFHLPNNYAPALIGDNTLTRFQTGRDLYAFISTRMPYQEPGILKPEEYWALTAFLLRAHSVIQDSGHLDDSNAASVPVHPAGLVEAGNTALVGGIVALPALAGLVAFTYSRRRRRASRP